MEPLIPIKNEPMSPIFHLEDIFSVMPAASTTGPDSLDLETLADFLQLQTDCDFKMEEDDSMMEGGAGMETPVGGEIPEIDAWNWDKPLSSVSMDFDFGNNNIHSQNQHHHLITSMDPHLIPSIEDNALMYK